LSLQSFLLRRALPAIAAAAVIAVPTAAQAQDEMTIPLHEPHRNTVAAEFGEPNCAQVPESKGEFEDGWVFVLPDNERRFLSVTAIFKDTDGNEYTYSTTNPDQGGIDPKDTGTSKAFIITPAGWTLVDASAVVDGPTKQGRFNLTHTCPGKVPPGEEESSPPVDTPTTEPGGEEPSSPSTDGPSTVPGVDDSTSPVADEKLSQTGAGLTWVIVGGVALIGAGAATLFLMRRRSAAESH
jgi:hypothetical protein